MSFLKNIRLSEVLNFVFGLLFFFYFVIDFSSMEFFIMMCFVFLFFYFKKNSFAVFAVLMEIIIYLKYYTVPNYSFDFYVNFYFFSILLYILLLVFFLKFVKNKTAFVFAGFVLNLMYVLLPGLFFVFFMQGPF